ncbi:MAG: TPM domain-containing protein [Streptococcaceae bacterium]|nr:TPM domain-containing protein [Streptococcaceae bacterium]
MKRKLMTLISLFLFTLIIGTLTTKAQENYIEQNTKATILTKEQMNTLNQTLNDFATSTQNGQKVNSQFAIYITDSLGGQSIESFALNLFNTKQIGDKTHNKGILFVIAINDHEYRIQLGDGWNDTGLNESTIEDYVFGDSLTDMLRDENYNGAITQIVNRTIAIAGTQIQVPASLQSHVEAYQVILTRQKEARANWIRIGFGALIVTFLGMITGIVVYLKRKQKQKILKQTILDYIKMEFAFDLEREKLPASDLTLANAFMETKLEANEDNIRTFLHNYKNNYQILQDVQESERTKNGEFRYKVNQQAIDLTVATPDRMYANDTIFDAIYFYDLHSHLYWSTMYFNDQGYSDLHDYEVQNNLVTDTNSNSDSSSWSDFGGGGGFSSGGGASGGW